MIGQVTFDDHGEQLTAVLNDDGRWTCPDRTFEQALNILHLCDNYSVAHGRFGWRQLHAAAEMLGGTVKGLEDNPSTEDLIY